LNCLKSNVLLASCREMKLVCARLGEASIPSSIARTLVKRAWDVPTNGDGRDARPHASASLTQRYGHAELR